MVSSAIKARKRRRAEYIELLGGKCSICEGIKQLEFDHIDPRIKQAEIGHLLQRDPMKMLDEEIKKCQLLCKQCHINKTQTDHKIFGPHVKFKPKMLGRPIKQIEPEKFSPIPQFPPEFYRPPTLAKTIDRIIAKSKPEKQRTPLEEWRASESEMPFDEWVKRKELLDNYTKPKAIKVNKRP